MAQFLRDEFLKNLTLTESKLQQLNEVFADRQKSIPNLPPQDAQEPSYVFLSYIIRFDNKGYRVFAFPELLEYFRRADYVERVIFTLETSRSLKTSRNVGSCMELRLDNKDSNLCTLYVSADERDWVDASFAAVKDVLARCQNLSWLMRGAWSQLLARLTGVFVGFVISLWAAMQISPKIAVDNSFFISFLFVLLIFSNLWGFLNRQLGALINVTFPNVRFYRPDTDRIHWLTQALIGGLIVAAALFALQWLVTYMGIALASAFSTPN